MTRYRNLAICVALALAVVACYWQVFGFGYVLFDDQGYVINNEEVRHGLSLAGVRWAFTTTIQANWHPLTWLSHMLDCQLFGAGWGPPAAVAEAGWHHGTNVALHIGSTIVLFLLLVRMTGAAWRSAVVAALFAVHPLHVESVAWIAERKDCLSTFLGMLALLAYARYTERPGAARYALVAALFALGLMAKPMLVTLPLLMLLLDFWPLGRAKLGRSDLRLVLEKVPLLVLSAASCVVTWYAQSTGGAVVSFERIPLPLRLANAAIGYVWYMVKMVVPMDLAIYYRYNPDLPMWLALGAAAVLIALTLGAILVARRRRYVAVGWFWYLGMLVPVIGLVQVGGQSVADRYSYVPLVGLFIAVVWGAADAAAGLRRGGAVAGAVAGAAVVACILITNHQVAYWADGAKLFQHTISVTGENEIANSNLATELTCQKRYAEAIEMCRAFLKNRPDVPGMHNVLAAALDADEQFEEAEKEFRESMRLRPETPEPCSNLAAFLAKRGRFREARPLLDEAIRMRPDDAGTHVLLGEVLNSLAMPRAAADEFRTALRLARLNARARGGLGLTLQVQGLTEEAVAQYRAALRDNPREFKTLNNLAWVLATSPDAKMRGGAEAVELAERAATIAEREDASCLDTLAAAYAEVGRFDDAVRTAEEAIEVAVSSKQADLVPDMRVRLELYRSGRPCRDVPAAQPRDPMMLQFEGVGRSVPSSG